MENGGMSEHCLFVNPCAQSRNTLIVTLVRDTADSCKHRSDTLGTLWHKSQMHRLAGIHTAFQNNTIKPFSLFASTCLNMEHSLNINSGYIKAVLCSTTLLCLCCLECSRIRCDKTGQQARGVPRAHWTQHHRLSPSVTPPTPHFFLSP